VKPGAAVLAFPPWKCICRCHSGTGPTSGVGQQASVERSRHVGFAPNSGHGAATQL